MNLQYRLGTKKDLPEICAVVAAVTKEMQKQNIFQWDAYYPGAILLEKDIAQNQLFVGQTEKQIAAIYVLNQTCEEEYCKGKWSAPEAPYYVLHRLCVRPELQNQGIGKATMANIEQTVLTRGIHWIRLDVFIHNPYALQLYQHFGYQIVGSVHWCTGEFYLMEKHLAQGNEKIASAAFASSK